NADVPIPLDGRRACHGYRPLPMGGPLAGLPTVMREGLVRLRMRCVSFRFLTAAPRVSAASISSWADPDGIDFSLRWRAASMPQLLASVWRRVERTSTGTWYVAPPTRRDFTSTTGFTLSSA